MNCPKCNAAVEPTAMIVLSRGEMMKAVLTDPRVWLVAFGVAIVTRMILGTLGIGGSSVGAGIGAVVGIFVGTRVGGYRRCPGCQRLVYAPPPKA